MTDEAEPPPPQNRRTREFRELFDRLPASVQELARRAFAAFVDNPAHPGLRHHALRDNSKGSHLPGSFSVSISMKYRAVYAGRGNVNLWYWVGTHADYDRLIGS